jgi:methyl-accepting chemotaxis protein
MSSNYRVAEAQHILTTSDAEMLRWDKTLHRLADKIAKTRVRYEPLISSEEERSIYQTFAHKYDEYISKSEKMLTLSRKNDNINATKELQHNRIMYDALTADLLKLVNLNAIGGTESAQQSKRIYYETQQIIFTVVLSLFMIAILFMIIFDKNISVALQRLTGLMSSLANGVIINNNNFKNRHDEIGQMAHALSVVTETLQALTNDSIELIDAGKAGILSARVDAQRHPGEFGHIVAGMNSLIDVLSKPLTEVAQIMQNLALGDLAGRMQGDYEGELRILKTNVNRSLDALVGLLTELSLTMQHMAEADLTFSLEGNYQGEFSVLKANTNHTIDYLVDMLKEIAISTAQSAAAISQTSEASRYVADESSKQMFAIENVSKTIEETAISVNEIAEKALQSSKLAYSTARFANDGQTLLNKLIELIQHIDAEYSRIEQITDQITRIADKTHLLSLNSGLEAMRAGEHGLGFGFVAQQIGLLAEEVSSSARDIGGVISSSGQKIRLGVHATQETQAAMEQISQAAQTSENNVQGISAAIVQQSAAVTSLTQRIGDIRISSEATASAAEEISTTMTHLSQTVQDTASLAKSFKLVDI